MESLDKDTLGCPHCDLLVDISKLRAGHFAVCPRCGGGLSRKRADAYNKVVSYALSALVALAMSCAFPFLSFSQAGLESTMTLIETPGMLWDNGLPAVALLVAAFIIVIPAVVMLLMLALCLPLRNGRWRPWLVPLGRWVFHLRHWAMVEVFIIGVIVSLVKIAHMAHVALGISFWAYIGFTVLFTLAVATLDRVQVWQTIDGLGSTRWQPGAGVGRS